MLLLCLSGCLFDSRPIGVEEVTPEEGYRAISTCALDGQELSAATRGVLLYYDLQKLQDEDPLAALRALHAHAVVEPSKSNLFALCELSFLHGRTRRDRDSYLASSVYAYYFLLGREDRTPLSPYDRRVRWACDMYASGLLLAFLSPDGMHFLPATGVRQLPCGKLNIELDQRELPRRGKPGEKQEEGERVDFLPADRFLPRGLDLRLRDSGLGVPLIGVYPRPKVDAQSRLQFGGTEMPATAFLRLDGPLVDLERGVGAALELHSGFESASVTVDGKPVPLETDRSVFLAHVLDRPEIWNFDLQGFFSSQGAKSTNKLILVQPYRRGRCPIVFVHGTASNPAYWADMFNSLWADPILRQRAQFWFFRYTTGNPVPYSAADLRDALNEAVQALDPTGTDPALRNMVVIGHSQGGLLAKLMVVKGRVTDMEKISGISLADLGLTPEQEKLMRRFLEYDPVPWVKRVVFLSTPHRGSFQATRWYSRILRDVISMPKELVDLGGKLTGKESKLPKSVLDRIPTSLDNMDETNPFLRNLLASKPPSGVQMHSIIAIGDADPKDPASLAKTDDGVVEYKSAHIDGVMSEILVSGGHSCQSHPLTIHEVRRILLEHVRSVPGAEWPTTPQEPSLRPNYH